MFFYHADSLAPIEQIKLLINNSDVAISDLHLAHITSLIQDLSILYIIIISYKNIDYFTIISS